MKIKTDCSKDQSVTAVFRTGRVNRANLLLILSTLFILAPKVDLIKIGSSGLRFEDFVFLAILPVLIWKYRPLRIKTASFLRIYLLFILSSFLSALLNMGELGPIGIVFVVRQLQYVVWFLVGMQFARFISEKSLRKCFGFIALTLTFWYIGETAGVIPKIGRFVGAAGRATLNTSGPYETAILVVIVFIMAPRVWHRVAMFIVLLATQSRITTAAFFVVWYQMRPSRNTLILAAAIPLGLLFFTILPNPIKNEDSRFAETQSFSSMITDLENRYRYVPQIGSLAEYRSYAVEGLRDNVDYRIGDPSFQIRVFKWSLIVKSLGGSASHFLFGWGPGAWGLAVDGHFVRFLGEGGVVGFGLAMLFFACALFAPDAPKPFRLGFMTMALSCLFIDAATSSKVMSTLWLIAGFYHCRNALLRPS